MCDSPPQRTRINPNLHKLLFDAERGDRVVATERSELLRAYNERPWRGKPIRQHDGTDESEVNHRDDCDGTVGHLLQTC